MKRQHTSQAEAARSDLRTIHRAEFVEALRDGRKQRAARIPDGKKKASREACRKGRW